MTTYRAQVTVSGVKILRSEVPCIGNWSHLFGTAQRDPHSVVCSWTRTPEGVTRGPVVEESPSSGRRAIGPEWLPEAHTHEPKYSELSIILDSKSPGPLLVPATVVAEACYMIGEGGIGSLGHWVQARSEVPASLPSRSSAPRRACGRRSGPDGGTWSSSTATGHLVALMRRLLLLPSGSVSPRSRRSITGTSAQSGPDTSLPSRSCPKVLSREDLPVCRSVLCRGTARRKAVLPRSRLRGALD